MHPNRFRPSHKKAWIFTLITLIVLTGCASVPSPLTPQSSNAREIRDLAIIIFVIAAIVFVVVEAALIYASIRYSRHAGSGLPRQVEGNQRLEVAWTLVPAIVLGIVFVISLPTLGSVAVQASASGNAGGDPPLQVRVVGHQWWWELDYPGLGIVSANELHVPVGTVVNVDVESVDVIHSYWVPQLGGKIDVVPGHVNHTWFKVEQAGTYHGQCAEFCGVQHANMRLSVIAESNSDFQQWVKQQQAQPAAVSGDAAKGQQTLLASACVGCHTITGTTAQGKIGPNLTHFASRQLFAGATLENTPENLSRWLADPQQVKPGALMPNLHLSPDQIQSLVAYLEGLK